MTGKAECQSDRKKLAFCKLNGNQVFSQLSTETVDNYVDCFLVLVVLKVYCLFFNQINIEKILFILLL
jgi:hypothetical protein